MLNCFICDTVKPIRAVDDILVKEQDFTFLFSIYYRQMNNKLLIKLQRLFILCHFLFPPIVFCIIAGNILKHQDRICGTCLAIMVPGEQVSQEIESDKLVWACRLLTAMLRGGWAVGQVCADPGARTPMGTSGNYYKYIQHTGLHNIQLISGKNNLTISETWFVRCALVLYSSSGMYIFFH